jgi:hypothetical protein
VLLQYTDGLFNISNFWYSVSSEDLGRSVVRIMDIIRLFGEGTQRAVTGAPIVWARTAPLRVSAIRGRHSMLQQVRDFSKRELELKISFRCVEDWQRIDPKDHPINNSMIATSKTAARRRTKFKVHYRICLSIKIISHAGQHLADQTFRYFYTISLIAHMFPCIFQESTSGTLVAVIHFSDLPYPCLLSIVNADVSDIF